MDQVGVIEAAVGVRGAGEGPDVRQCAAANPHESAEQLAREIVELIDVGGLAPGSVTILSPFDYADSSVVFVREDVAKRIRRLDEYSMRATPGDAVGFARIDEFKGLENEAIVVVDLSSSRDWGGSSAMQYVAMSRARSVLSIVNAEFSENLDRSTRQQDNPRE